MAFIHFSSDQAHQRFLDCKKKTEAAGDTSLQRCIDTLKRWQRDIIIGCDFDELSFTFREDLTDEERYKGYHPVCGGIIYHGPRDGFGNGEGPTFSVCMTPTTGYAIHT